MNQFLTFHVAGGEYGVEVLRVKEIIEYEKPTPMPQAPPAVRGLINLRGAVVPVLDLAVKLGLPPQPATRRSCIVIVEAEQAGGVLGLAVDSVSQVIDLAEGEVESAPDFGLPVRADTLRGLGKVKRGFVLLLDIDRLLAAVEPRAEAAA